MTELTSMGGASGMVGWQLPPVPCPVVYLQEIASNIVIRRDKNFCESGEF